MIDHLVVHGHQEQRRRQRQQVDHHRGDPELPQHRAQPGEHGVTQARLPRLAERPHQHDPFREVGDCVQTACRGAPGARLEQEQMILYPPGRDQSLAGHPADDQEGRRRAGEVVPAGLERARLEAEPLGREQDAADAEPAVGRRGRRPDLGQGERPVEHPAQLGEREDLAIGGGRGGRRTALWPAPGRAHAARRTGCAPVARQKGSGRPAPWPECDVRARLADGAREGAHGPPK